jgi:hypothetical protein
MTLSAVFESLQGNRFALAVSHSTLWTGLTSGLHLLGLTLVVGGAVVTGLRLLGMVLTDRPVSDVARPVGRGMLLGLAVSVTTGVLMFAPRAGSAASDRRFQTKMALLAAAALFHFGVTRRAVRTGDDARISLKLVGALELLLWLGVALAGAAFILLE